MPKLKIVTICLIILFLSGCLAKPPAYQNKYEPKIPSQDIENVEKFCKKSGGVLQIINNNQYNCIINNAKLDAYLYYLEECKPLGEKCIIFEEKSALETPALPAADSSEQELQEKEFVGKLYTLPKSSRFDDYLLIQREDEEIRYGVEARSIDKEIDQDIQNTIRQLSDNDLEIVIKGHLIDNAEDVGGHRIIVNKIFLKETNPIILDEDK